MEQENDLSAKRWRNLSTMQDTPLIVDGVEYRRWHHLHMMGVRLCMDPDQVAAWVEKLGTKVNIALPGVEPAVPFMVTAFCTMEPVGTVDLTMDIQ